MIDSQTVKAPLARQRGCDAGRIGDLSSLSAIYLPYQIFSPALIHLPISGKVISTAYKILNCTFWLDSLKVVVTHSKIYRSRGHIKSPANCPLSCRSVSSAANVLANSAMKYCQRKHMYSMFQ
ncbi:hypothetical protein Bxe_C1099 [Paraburkholderia xenovorans LB400]|uniref:Uncharacterized protein n=1 Tax=Paraburkholderia xenovorans (strain LB400) TaxID=266265 RepID=Q13G23_PARXL|nr:hypothetical protein Bxe_C1099 [Paraburkholderia xenovorans LB400]